MKRPDYNFAKHIAVPDAWIEKALAIPSAVPQKPAVIAVNRRWLAAAGVVLALGLSVAVYFFFGNKNVLSTHSAAAIPTDPAASAAADVSATQAPSAQPSGAGQPTAPPAEHQTETAPDPAAASERETS